MNPLISTNKVTGIFTPVYEKDRETFISRINDFHKHFVLEHGWVDPDTLSAKPKPWLIVRLVANIVNAIGLRFFNKHPQIELEKIKNGLSSYIGKNREWIGRDKSELNEDLIVKIWEINKTLADKDKDSFLSQTFGKNFISASTWPWISAQSHVANIAGIGALKENPHDIFTTLGWDPSRIKI